MNFRNQNTYAIGIKDEIVFYDQVNFKEFKRLSIHEDDAGSKILSMIISKNGKMMAILTGKTIKRANANVQKLTIFKILPGKNTETEMIYSQKIDDQFKSISSCISFNEELLEEIYLIDQQQIYIFNYEVEQINIIYNFYT